MKKFLFIVMIILFILIDIYTLFLASFDILFPPTTIEVQSQDEYIVREVKEYYNINFEIKKIVHRPSFPDGYSIELYNDESLVEPAFFDISENYNIDDYFREIGVDKELPKYLKILILEIIAEAILIVIIVRKNKNKMINI